MIRQFIRRRNMSMKSVQGRRAPGSRDECRTAPDLWANTLNKINNTDWQVYGRQIETVGLLDLCRQWKPDATSLRGSTAQQNPNPTSRLPYDSGTFDPCRALNIKKYENG